MTHEQRFGTRLREVRQALGMSQQELAAAMTERGFGWHQTTAAKTEAADRPIRLNEAAALAELLGVRLIDMLCNDVPEQSTTRAAAAEVERMIRVLTARAHDLAAR